MPKKGGAGKAGLAMLGLIAGGYFLSRRKGSGNVSGGGVSTDDFGSHYSYEDLTVTGTGLDNSPDSEEIMENLVWLSNVLQDIVDNVIGYAPPINSAYRNKTVNTKVGGSSTSSHMSGLAVDLHFGKTEEAFEEKWRVAQRIIDTNLWDEGYIDQIIIYDSNSNGSWYGGGGKSHVHVGFSRTGNGRRQFLVTPRGNSGTYTTVDVLNA